MAVYRSFLLRVWRSNRSTGQQWSARLEGLQDGQRQQFTDVDALLVHLRGLLAAELAAGPLPTTRRPDQPDQDTYSEYRELEKGHNP